MAKQPHGCFLELVILEDLDQLRHVQVGVVVDLHQEVGRVAVEVGCVEKELEREHRLHGEVVVVLDHVGLQDVAIVAGLLLEPITERTSFH